MKHSDGIEAVIINSIGNMSTEYQNPYSMADDDLEGGLASSLIREDFGEVFELSITFDDSFDLRGADGVKLVIAIGEDPLPKAEAGSLRNVQAVWIPQEHVHGQHRFSAFRLWNHDIFRQFSSHQLKQFAVPKPDRGYV